MILCAKKLTAEIRSVANTASRKLATPKPGTKVEMSQNRKPFITKVKSPSVRMFIGSVRRIITGLTKTFIRPQKKETMRAV